MNNECHIYIISMGGNATERDEKGIMIFVEWKLTVLMYCSNYKYHNSLIS